jgi:hypothetical protein
LKKAPPPLPPPRKLLNKNILESRPKLNNRLRQKFEIKRIDWCVELIDGKSRASRRYLVGEANPNG